MREIRLFGHYLSPPLVMLLVLDAMVVGASVYWAAAGASAIGTQLPLVALALSGAAAIIIGKIAVGLYHINLRTNLVGVFTRTLVALLVGLPLAFIAAALSPLDASVLLRALLAGVLAYGVMGLAHAAFFALADAGALRRRVLVLGSGTAAAGLRKLRRRADRRGFELVGFVALDNGNDSALVEPLLDPDGPLSRLAAVCQVDEIVVALEERRAVLPIRELVECRFAGVRVTDLATFTEREAGKVRLDLVRAGWLVFDGNPTGRLHAFTKRTMDIAGSLLLLMLALPVIIAAVIAVKREEGWRAPLIYRQQRVGLNGRAFALLKFRSMRVDAESDGRPRWATPGDSRITQVGRVLRKTRIDELPQLLNVLRGDMSLVGPRPERPEFVAELERDIPYYAERHRIKPGVTGWAQVLYPYGASREDAAEKLQYDLYYLKHRSIALDLLILLQTVEVVFFGKGAR